MHALEDRITEAAAAIGGEHVGDEFGGPGAYAVERYRRAKDPNAREERVELA